MRMVRPAFIHKRLVRLGLVMFVAGLSVIAPACKTSESGVKSTQFAQYTTMEVGTAKGTSAAESVLKDLGLKDVTASSTNLDGWAKGAMSDKTIVKVGLERVGQAENLSEVTVTVGSFGDPTLGKDIINRMRKNLGIEPPPPPSTSPSN